MTLIVITGVGTDIGKTHVTAALSLAWGRETPVLAYKPIESGVVAQAGPDEALLASVSTFHVKHPLLQFRLRAPVSPHLAAREEGVTLDLQAVAEEVSRVRRVTDMLVELPGGLFSPLSDTEVGADLVQRLGPDVVLLVAPNRLGVLHDVRAVAEAGRGRRLALDGVVLNAPSVEDASSASNPAELALTSGLPVLAKLQRGALEELAASRSLLELLHYCRRIRPKPTALE
jgi:dethiobiotin synthetase